MRILIVGSLDGEYGGEGAGGTSILLRSLIDELDKRPDVATCVFDIGTRTSAIRRFAGAARAMAYILGMIKRLPRADVVTLHGGTIKLWFTGPIALTLSRIAGKPLLLRKFGGGDYADLSWWKRGLTRWAVSRCDAYLVESKHLVDAAITRDRIDHCHWFPTHRPLDTLRHAETKEARCRRFVFIGQVREYKGLRELVAAAEHPDLEATVDVYGPLFDDLPADLFQGRRRIFYRGLLASREVVPTMRRYGAMVMPTKATTEGYPGAILEAYAAGIPVITTPCGAIPEIVDDTSGLLVPPGDVEALLQAMKSLGEDAVLYERLCQGARKRAGDFSAEYWAERFVEFCREIAK